jgi:hypothetical protein
MTDQCWQLLQYLGILAAAVLMVFVLAWRRRSHAQFLEEYAEREVCEHLLPALELLRSRGHRVVRAGQQARDLPLELHLAPGFDPKQLLEELKLGEPVFLSSERNVLYCKEDWCELHPKNG